MNKAVRKSRKNFVKISSIILGCVFGVTVICFAVFPAFYTKASARGGENDLEETPSFSPPPTQAAFIAPTPKVTGPVTTAGPLAAFEEYRIGDEDESIKEIQISLMSLGYCDTDEPTSMYMPSTENAVKLFQRSHYMLQTGVADALVQSVLFSGSAKPYVIEEGNSGNDVEMLQKQLLDLGYYYGKTNGYFGAATTRAVKSFQAINGLVVDGKVDREDQDILFSPSALTMNGSEASPAPTPDAHSTSEPTNDTSNTPKPERTPKPTATPKPDATSRPGVTPSPRPSAAPTPTPKATPKPTPKDTPKPTPKPQEGDVEAFIAVAMDQLGKPYEWSEEGPDSFDCSGLIYYCLRQVGVSTRRYSAQGFSEVEEWERISSQSSLKRGDLVFFYSPGSSRIGHVGIFLGSSKYLHASTSANEVIISSWNSWAKEYFALGRRVF